MRKTYSWLESGMLNEYLSERKIYMAGNGNTFSKKAFWKLCGTDIKGAFGTEVLAEDDTTTLQFFGQVFVYYF